MTATDPVRSSPQPDQPDQPGQPELRRVMGGGLLLLFIVGDVLGTGVYALSGEVAGEVGGAAWAPFALAFVVASLTACSYLELVTKYPRAAGAALYAHRAFKLRYLTFLVAFAVMCSGITSASTASSAFATNALAGFDLTATTVAVTAIALVFMAAVGLINLRGVSESVRTNVVLTLVELTGLLIVIVIGFVVIGRGDGDLAAVTRFSPGEHRGVLTAVTAATALAFYAMVGFEDSVNMAEETRDPSRTFPRAMLTGLAICGLVYVLVAIASVAIVPVELLADSSVPPLLRVVEAGAPGLPVDRLYPFITMVAVANSALINMLMASRLLYGMANVGVLPRALGRVHPQRRTPWISIGFTTLLAFALIVVVAAVLPAEAISTLGGTTSLLLLAVFAVVNTAVLVLRRESVPHRCFRAPTAVPVAGALSCIYLLGPWTGRNPSHYAVGGALLLVGVVLAALTRLARDRGDAPDLPSTA